MPLCPVCETDYKVGLTTCPVCGSDITEVENAEWIRVGMIEDKISADYALETLRSYQIPSVVISKSGFFGAAGLPLTPFYKPQAGFFEVMVPAEYRDEATDILDMILGSNWYKEDDV